MFVIPLEAGNTEVCWSATGVILEQASRVLVLDGVFTIETNFDVVDLVFILLLLVFSSHGILPCFCLVLRYFYGATQFRPFSVQ